MDYSEFGQYYNSVERNKFHEFLAFLVFLAKFDGIGFDSVRNQFGWTGQHVVIVCVSHIDIPSQPRGGINTAGAGFIKEIDFTRILI